MGDAIDRHLDQARQRRASGDVPGAGHALAEAADLARTAGDSRLAYALRHLSDLQREANLLTESHASAGEAVAVLRAAGPSLDLANALRLRALAADALGFDRAAADWAEAGQLYRALGVAEGVADCEARS